MFFTINSRENRDYFSSRTEGWLSLGLLDQLNQRLNHVNAAAMGPKLTLTSDSKRVEAWNIASQIQYVELAADPHFARTSTQATF